MGKKQEEAPAGAPAWMVTYGDLVTLLLTFFVLLLSFSETEVAKFDSAMGSLQGALGVGTTTETSFIPNPDYPLASQGGARNAGEDDTMEETMKKMESLVEAIDSLDLDSEISLIPSKDGVTIRVSTETLFKSGSAVIEQDFYPVLDEVAILTTTTEDQIVVEGHTDDQPISTSQFPSNWELSGARAGSIIRYFVSKSNLEASKFELRGYAETVPLMSNESSEGRAANRRVDIFIKNSNEKDDES